MRPASPAHAESLGNTETADSYPEQEVLGAVQLGRIERLGRRAVNQIYLKWVKKPLFILRCYVQQFGSSARHDVTILSTHEVPSEPCSDVCIVICIDVAPAQILFSRGGTVATKKLSRPTYRELPPTSSKHFLLLRDGTGWKLVRFARSTALGRQRGRSS